MDDKGLHDERMDEYVRRSFEGLEELPPDDMWERIEADLVDDRRRPGFWPWLGRNRWPAAAAAMLALLISISVCQYQYYEKRLEDVRKIAAQSSKTITIPTETIPPPTLENPYAHQEKTVMSANGALVHNQTNAQAGEKTNDIQQPMGVTVPVSLASNGYGEIVENKGGEMQVFPQLTVSVVQVPLGPVFPLDASQPLGQLHVQASSTQQPPISPIKKSGSWYMGFSASPHVGFEKNRGVPLRPGVRPIVASKQERVAFSSAYWLNVGKKTSRSPYFVETGIGYERAVRVASHNPRLRFGDGLHVGGGMGQRRYNYTVGTYNGTAEVGLRMEQTIPGTPTSDDEPIVLTIQTRETAEMLHIPLLGGVEWGRGWLKGRAKAGMVFNGFLKNELEITASTSQNAGFRPVGGKNYTVQLKESRKFFPAYWISAGASAQVGKQCRFVVEPWFSGDFSRKDASGYLLPQYFGAGLNFSTQYLF